MGTSSSSNQVSETTESKCDYDYLEKDELSDVEKEKLIKELIPSLARQNEQLKKIYDAMEQEQKTGGVTPRDTKTILLTQIKNPIPQVNCYLNFLCHVVVIYRILINLFVF